MKKGFTLIELMIAICIITVLASVGVVSIKNRSEKNALIKMKNEIPTYLSNQMNKAYDFGEKYIVKYNESQNRLETYFGNTLIEKLDLENSLNYHINPTENKIDAQGAYESEMIVNVLDNNDSVLFNVHVTIVDAVNSSKIEVN